MQNTYPFDDTKCKKHKLPTCKLTKKQYAKCFGNKSPAYC